MSSWHSNISVASGRDYRVFCLVGKQNRYHTPVAAAQLDNQLEQHPQRVSNKANNAMTN